MHSPGSPRSVGVGGEPSTVEVDVSMDRQEAADRKKSSASGLLKQPFTFGPLDLAVHHRDQKHTREPSSGWRISRSVGDLQ